MEAILILVVMMWLVISLMIHQVTVAERRAAQTREEAMRRADRHPVGARQGAPEVATAVVASRRSRSLAPARPTPPKPAVAVAAKPEPAAKPAPTGNKAGGKAVRKPAGKAAPALSAGAMPEQPAVPVARAVTEEALFCLVCGKGVTILKSHLTRSHGVALEDYRKHFALPDDFPTVAPGHAAKRRGAKDQA